MLNKTVFITGSSRGIGLSMAKAFSEDGYFVIGTSRSQYDLEATLGTKNCLHLILDVTDRDAIKQALALLDAQSILPSVIVNNAGITKDQLLLNQWLKLGKEGS